MRSSNMTGLRAACVRMLAHAGCTWCDFHRASHADPCGLRNALTGDDFIINYYKNINLLQITGAEHRAQSTIVLVLVM